MSLKFQLETLEGLDQPIAALYTEVDGKFFLDVDGAVSKTKLDEFRNTNIDLMKKLDAFKDIDPVEVKSLKSEITKLKASGKTPEEIDKIVNERVQTMREELTTELTNEKTSNQNLRSQLSRLVIDSSVRDAATKSGALPSATDDLLLRAQMTFTVEDGHAIAKDSKGNVLYDKDGSTPLSIDSWVKSLKKSAPHLFNMPSGGGSGGGGGRHGLNPANMSSLDKIKAGLAE